MYLNEKEIQELINRRDLTQEKNHCISLMIEKIRDKLTQKYSIQPIIEKGSKIVSTEDNYYALGYNSNEVTLGVRYTKYINEKTILRTQMTSVIPTLLKSYQNDGDKVWMCPGMVYRRDVKDKTHIGEPHQMDIWYLTKKTQTRKDLLELVEAIISTIETVQNKKIKWRHNETSHHYTDQGIEVEIYNNNQWLELLECGLISRQLLTKNNLDNYSGLALGLGLERLAMITKNIDDIRVLYSNRIEIQSQLCNLEKYKDISNQPSIKRDLSISLDENINEEDLTELILVAASKDTQSLIESIKVISETNYVDLPKIAIDRLGMKERQKNILLRITLRNLTKTITNEDANVIYMEIYEKIHKGSSGYII